MDATRLSRRTVVGAAAAAVLGARLGRARAQGSAVSFSYPIGMPGQVLGDGFFMRHGYACENTWYNPGWLHTGEDWYVHEGTTAGAGVYAIADGEIVFAGSEYPGLVVIVRHAADLYSMYGHLNHVLAVETGPVTRGQMLGTVLERSDGSAPSHLHVEVRTFLTTPEVNGNSPRYDVSCGFECPPGPGYWPIDAPEHPSNMGWRNPTHVIAWRSIESESPPEGVEVIVPERSSATTGFWTDLPDEAEVERVGELPLTAGDRYRLLAIETGEEASLETSAEGYRLWYQIEIPDAGNVWVQAAVPSTNDTGSDGRPSSVTFDFLPAVSPSGMQASPVPASGGRALRA
jgi:hypothetical protein